MSEELAEADANLAEIARLRRQLALAEAEIATLRAEIAMRYTIDGATYELQRNGELRPVANKERWAA